MTGRHLPPKSPHPLEGQEQGFTTEYGDTRAYFPLFGCGAIPSQKIDFYRPALHTVESETQMNHATKDYLLRAGSETEDSPGSPANRKGRVSNTRALR